MLLALAIADHADDDGTSIYPSISMLAAKTRQSERTVQYQLRRMEQTGWLILVNAGNGGRSQRREYRINPDWIKGAEIAPLQKGANDSTKGAGNAPFTESKKGAIDDLKGAIHDIKGANDSTKGCNPLHPHITVIEPSEEPSGTISNRARKPKAPAFDATTVDLPDWLPTEIWERWVRHRIQLKKPITEEAARQQLEDLAAYRRQGHDPVEIIKHSIGKSWQGLFAPKQPFGQRAAPAANESQRRREEFLRLAGQGGADSRTIDMEPI